MEKPSPLTPREKVAEIQEKGFCVLRAHLGQSVIQSCREAFWPILLDYVQRNRDKPNRGENRHFLAMPFEPVVLHQSFSSTPDFLASPTARWMIG